MTTLNAIIECLEGGYSAYIESLDGVVATGSTVDEIKRNLISALDEYVETCKELNCELPVELTGDFTIDFSMDVKSLLSLYDGIFTKSGLERLTGINQKQLWHYANGMSKPRRAQALKIETALHRLGYELIAIHL
jgi:predicted RNase H-like HicB family nuclease